MLHLGGSFLLFLVLASIIYFLWYPDYLFWTGGGLRGVYILICVDLTIGPLLTLLVYNRAKPGIKFDMCAIFLVQVVCIVGGMGTLWYSKPLAIVFESGQFYSPTRLDFVLEEGKKLDDKFDQMGKPDWYFIDGSNASAVISLITASLLGGQETHLNPSLYESYEPEAAKLVKEGLTLEEAVEEGILTKAFVSDVKNENADRSLRVFKFSNAFNTGRLVIDVKTGKVVTYHLKN